MASGGLCERNKASQAEDMGVAVQLIERTNLRILSGEIIQKMANGSAIAGDGCITQRSGNRFRRWLEELCQRVVGERKNTFWFHDCDGGMGRMSWATARAYCSQTSCGVS